MFATLWESLVLSLELLPVNCSGVDFVWVYCFLILCLAFIVLFVRLPKLCLLFGIADLDLLHVLINTLNLHLHSPVCDRCLWEWTNSVVKYGKNRTFSNSNMVEQELLSTMEALQCCFFCWKNEHRIKLFTRLVTFSSGTLLVS